MSGKAIFIGGAIAVASAVAYTNAHSPVGTTTAAVSQPPSGCHPSYKGACVPITSDVDGIGGRGNGPAYVGRVIVVGPDVYGLDHDGDGIGCERASAAGVPSGTLQ